MTTAAPPAPPAAEHDDYRVKPLELFFDLVFVFALTQVTKMLADDPTVAGVARGVLVLAALWWAWAGYTWLTTTIDPEEGLVRIAFFAAMAAWTVAGLAVPGAFGGDAALFGGAYLSVRLAHVGVFLIAAWGAPGLRGAVVRSAPFWVLSPAMILGAALLDGVPQGAVWAAALALDYGSGLLGRGGGWRLHAGHFAERHGLIIIVALGESIVAVGAGASGVELTAGPIVAACLGIVVVAAIWWTYFDVAAIVAERRLHEATGDDQARQARDSYSYLHFLMVLGIVLFAFGTKQTLGHHDEPLGAVAAASLVGGVALYLLAHILFRLRNTRSLNRARLAVTAALVGFAVVADRIDALAALAVVAAVVVALVAYEAIRSAEARHRIRHAR